MKQELTFNTCAMKTIYLATSNSSFPDHSPTIRGYVWIGIEGDPNIKHSRVYSSEDYVKMLTLANKMAKEHFLSLTSISLDLTWDHMYTTPASQMPTQVLKAEAIEQ